MKQEDKELLLKDLSARFPYGVYCKIDDEEQSMLLYSISGDTIGFVKNIAAMMVRSVTINRVKPYLRPMSSMTEEECKELHKLVCPNNVGASFDIDAFYFLEADCHSHSISYTFMSKVIEFMLQHHLDFNGLIPKGLALEAPSDLYKIN